MTRDLASITATSLRVTSDVDLRVPAMRYPSGICSVILVSLRRSLSTTAST